MTSEVTQKGAPMIIVCIPTYKRRDQLKALAKAVSEQTFFGQVSLLIGNNDELSVSKDINLTGRLHFLGEIMVDGKGVSIVRNTLIREALARAPAARWIVFIDDDQVPTSDWLENLVRTGERFGADLVGGPSRQIPEAPGFWASAAAVCAEPAREGPVAMLNGTGNLLLSAAYLRSLDRPPFSVAFGRTGGEDFEFFLYSAKRGAKMYWSPRAHVSEILPAQRSKFLGMSARSFRQRAYQTRAMRLHFGLGYTLAESAKYTATTPLVFLRSLACDRSLSLALGLAVKRIAGSFGSFAGLLGATPVAYGQ